MNSKEKKKGTVILLAYFFGLLGAHHFYMGNNEKGWKYLVVSLFAPIIGAIIIGIFCIIDMISLLYKSDEEFLLMVAEKDEKIAIQEKETQDVETPKIIANDLETKEEQLRQIKELFDTNVITELEFNALKKNILGE